VRVKNAAGAARAVSNGVTIVAAALPEQHGAQKGALESAPSASSPVSGLNSSTRRHAASV
jgi:hypothetical protein